MAGFEEAGLPGRHHIKDGFLGSEEAGTFVSNFQDENCVLLPSLRPALHLLDLQDVRHITFHQSILEELKERFQRQIKECNERKMVELLNHIFQFIHVDLLRPLILSAMTKVPDIKPEFIEQLADNPNLYSACPIEVKRQVWIKRHPLFGDAVGPLLNKYIEEKHTLLYSTELVASRNFFSLPPRQRRQKPTVKELVDMIGHSIELYNLVLQFLRTLFLRTKEEHYCSLRSELLMAFHDADVKEIRLVDPCHKFTWCLDACIRDKSIDSKRLKELQSFLDNTKKGQEEIIGDVAMIFYDPYAVNSIILSIFQQLNRLIKIESLPRKASELQFLLRTLALSCQAWSMIKSQSFKEPTSDSSISTQFLPLLMNVMVDENMASASPKSSKGWEITVPGALWKFVQNQALAESIMWYYIVHLLQKRQRLLLDKLLTKFAQALNGRPAHPSIMNLVVHYLAKHPEDFSSSEYCTHIFDNFLFAWLDNEDTLHHILRLLWCVHEKMESHQIVRLLTVTQPATDFSEVVQDLHARLVDTVAAQKASSTPSSSGEHSNPISPATPQSPPIAPYSMPPFATSLT